MKASIIQNHENQLKSTWEYTTVLSLQRRLWHMTPASVHAPPGVYEQFMMELSLPLHLTLLYTVGPLLGPKVP